MPSGSVEPTFGTLLACSSQRVFEPVVLPQEATRMSFRDRVLGSSAGFKLFKRLIASDRAMGVFADEYIRARDGQRVLDVACGLGDMLDHLPAVSYVGIDTNQDYITTASRIRGSERARFLCASTDDLPSLDLAEFDIALVISALHHLTDAQVSTMVSSVQHALKPGGRLVTVDPVWKPDQRTTARVLIALDRGRYVRDLDGYARLLEKGSMTSRSRFARTCSDCRTRTACPSLFARGDGRWWATVGTERPRHDDVSPRR